MKLLKINKNDSMYFELSDGRLGIVYKSGYVRITTKSSHKILYSINKLTKGNNHYKKDLISNPEDRIKMLFAFNQNNCI